MAMPECRLRIERVDSVEGLLAIAAELHACNARAARPSAFALPGFVAAYVRHNEYFPNASMRLRTYVARDQHRVHTPSHEPIVGYVMLRHSFDKVAGPWRGGRLDFAVTHDTDEPGVLAVAGRETEVAAAILHHLIDHERDWSMLECVGQHDGAVLRDVAPTLTSARIRWREIPMDPFSTVTITWPTLAAYYGALSKRMRSNVSRQTRRLYAAGAVELIFAHGGATGALFDAHLGLEDRSWKHGTDAAIRRASERVAFFRELAHGRAGLEPSYVGVALNGVLIAGLLNATFGDSTWSLDMSYDATHSELGPGQLPLLLTIGDAIGHHRRSVHFLQFFSYFKERWLADSHPAVVLQLLRRPSLWDTRAMAGDLRVRMAGRPGTIEPVLQNAKREGSPSLVDEASSRALLDAARSKVCVLDAVAAARILPFSIEETGGDASRPEATGGDTSGSDVTRKN